LSVTFLPKIIKINSC